MIKAISILQNLRVFRLKTLFKSKTDRKEFYNDINYISLNRLRIFGYFMVVLVLALLVSDFFLKDFWKTGQMDHFMILDIILGIVSLTVFYVTNFKAPKSASEIKSWMVMFLYSYVLFHILWVSSVGIVESATNNSLPTYILGVFSASILFIIQSWIFLMMLIICLLYLLTGFYISGMSLNTFVTQYSSLFVLITIAWIISRALFITRMRSFLTTKELEITRNNLDKTVKERTAELQKANEQLIVEIRVRKNNEKILEREKKRALEADRLKSVFLANMSHEIRTPLNGILGFSDLLQSPKVTQEKKEKYLNIINSNGQQLLKIIDDILDISMIESNQLKANLVSYNLNHLFPDTIEFFKNYKKSINKEHIEIISDGTSSEINDIIYSDPTRLQQVLYNLLNNSFKFTNEGYIKFGCRVDNGFVLVFVEDSGIGIDNSIRRTIFKRFRQGDESISRGFGGSGLGLSISRGIVEMLKGMIWHDLSFKGGARFCFSIPKNSMDTEIILHKKKDFEFMRKKRILILENDFNEFNFVAESFNNIKVPVYHTVFSNITEDANNLKSDLIIIDSSNFNGSLGDVISNIRDITSNIPIFTILSDNNQKDSESNNAGSTKTFIAPLNIQFLFNECVEFFKRNN
jgi:signal transduction histidine kinase